MSEILITTTPVLEGYTIKEYLGVVNTNIVIGTNLFSDFFASVTDVFGGNSETYQGKMDKMYVQAKDGLSKKAKLMGANSIVGFKVDFDEISGKGKSMFMLSATGTACIVESSVNHSSNKDSFGVSSISLSNEKRKRGILEKIESDTLLNNYDDDWRFIEDNLSKTILAPLVKQMYYKATTELKAIIESMVSRLDYEDACEVVYSAYIEPNILVTNPYTDYKEDVSYVCARIIKNCKLLNLSYLKELFIKEPIKAIKILDCEKPFYDKEDLMVMQELCTQIDNIPDVGKKEISKEGIFSKEKEIYVCRHGHKNDASVEFCVECRENIKGLTKDDMLKIDKFKETISVLSSMMNK